MTISLKPVGFVRGGRREAADDLWEDVECRIELVPEFGAEAFDGIETFSHVEVVYYFHQLPDDRIECGSRHPRGNPDWPQVGIFAQRGRNRLNKLGVSVARVIGREGTALVLRGLDAIDGTPVLDVKPVMREFQPQGGIIQPAWTHELMSRYWR